MTDLTATEIAEGDGAAEGAGGDATARSGRMPGKKLVLFIALPMLLIGLAGAGIYFSGLADALIGVERQEGELLTEDAESPSIYFDVPDMLANLNTSGRKTGYVKVSVSLEVGSEEDVTELKKVLPRIIDNFQVYLRELRVEDLSGSAGLQRLREELLLRATHAAAPTVVRDVLFREMLIQ